MKDDRARFLSHVIKGEGCWTWIGAVSKKTGYGVSYLNGKTMTASRASHLLFNGPLSSIEQAHHTCENRQCVNPDHLERTTHRRHLVDLTPNGVAYKNKRKTHCPKGHAYSPENTVVYAKKNGNKSRFCIACRKAKNHPRPPKTHCSQGHEFTRDSTYIRPDTRTRQCLICQNLRNQLRHENERANRTQP